MPDMTAKTLLHELKVHQLELEMQNEELRRVQIELASARDRYLDLYDFSPVGYFTLAENGVIIEANLTASTMFGDKRQTLLGRNFARFVAADGIPAWHRYLKRAFQEDGVKRVELSLKQRNGTPFDGQLDCLLMLSAERGKTLRVAMTDISERKQSEAYRRTANTVIDASETERRQVSRQLHEELGQRLSVLKMDLFSFNAASNNPPQLERRHANMMTSLDDAMAIVRRIASDMRPLMLDDLGLNAAIDWLASDSAKRLKVEVAAQLDTEDPPASERATIALYRMAYDMLNEMAGIGFAHHIDIALHRQGAHLELAVKGHGNLPRPPSGEIARSGMMQSLQERARVLQGRFSLESLDSEGLQFAVNVPIEAALNAQVSTSR